MIKRLKHFILFIFLVSFSVQGSAALVSFENNSLLAQGRFVKIRIVESGVYRLTFEDLNAMGVTPANVRIFGYGGAVLNQNFTTDKPDDLPELAIYMHKGADGVFNVGDYILFYAQGVNKWSWDSSLQFFKHQLNHYSNYGYYFVSSDAGTGKKIETSTSTQTPTSSTIREIKEFTDYAVYEKELQNLVFSGKEFYGETFSEMLNLNIPFNFPNTIKNTGSLKARLDVAALSGDASTFTLELNNGQPKTLTVAKKTDNYTYEKGKAANAIFTYTPTLDQQTMKLSFAKTNSAAKGYLNYVALNVRRNLKLSGATMPFRSIDYLGVGSVSRFKLSATGENVQVWDITDQLNVKAVNASRSADTLVFDGVNDKLREYVAVDPSMVGTIPKPEVVGVVSNQNLHATPQVDMVIISHPNFISQAERLAQAHRNQGELSVAVVSTEDIYNEFSSGAPDATAYRYFLKMLYDRADGLGDISLRPKYLLLFGRGSYDNRMVNPGSSSSYVLTYQAENSLVETYSYTTDDYFGMLHDTYGNNIPAHKLDVAVGRYTVSSVQEATDVVSKQLTYMQNTRKGIWKNQLLFLADDGDGALHMRDSDTISSMVARTFPSYQVNKIHLDAYQQEVSASGESYPVARAQFHNLIRSGVLMVNYMGHAGATGWTNEQILSNADVKNFSNQNLPFWIAATCNFVQFDNPIVSAGEQVLLNPVGGGIGIISATRPVYASQNKRINQFINQYLYAKEDGKYRRLGDVVKMAKNSIGNEINKLNYVLVGDPALRLNYPGEYQVITNKINSGVVEGKDTLRALSVASFEGYVADENGNAITDFNGYLQANVYDKRQRIQTLNNDKNGYLVYYDRPNMLFSGQTEVVDGKFSFTFMLPKDIKYNYGTGRINFYAHDVSLGSEAHGSFENFLIGGSQEDFEYETDGPEVKMYLNRPDFVSGDKVNETPFFVAQVSDVSGINQIGSGIGHDIVLTIDDDPGQSYILNDHYQSALNDYSSGTIRFKLPELRTGMHKLTFRVWDLLNNSTTESMEFEVVRGLDPVIFNIYNYPNPVQSYTRFMIEHDRPETVLNATVNIYDLSGRLLWSVKQSTLEEIQWDATDSNGYKLQNGVYLYRVSIETNSTTIHSRMNKILVVD